MSQIFSIRWFCVVVLGSAGLISCQAQSTQVPGQVAFPAQSSALVDPDFSLTAADFSGLLADVPAPFKSAIQARAAQFLSDYKPLLSLPWDRLVRADKTKSLPADYEPTDLVHLSDYGLHVTYKDRMLRQDILPAVQALDQAARKAGLTLLFASTYRSYKTQDYLYNSYVAKDGRANADRYSARPGTSQHQLGTVIDFGDIQQDFADTKEGRWLKAHGSEFGFSLSYPQGYEKVTGYMWEPWHYRYIGPEACAVQDKYFGGIQQYLVEFHDRNAETLRKALKKP